MNEFISQHAQKHMPLHLLLMEEAPEGRTPRYAVSAKYRTHEFLCHWFYKEISRCIDLWGDDGSDGP